MAEALNLPPVDINAVRIPIRRPPESITGPDEMMLQQGENGRVQVDIFGRDAQGNELHESKEMQEDEYETLRASYLRAARPEEFAQPIVHQHFQASGATIGKQISAVRQGYFA